ncbi:general odorant-binding protein 70 [Drosophila miranda]|uniref:general odorant-binding protein 70 n=1 Tax=Drosophila miranda TaxID=7229 RepID=UPI0007E86B04|nr:general odorant-binding protein 70 [Drosophila miranda]
MKITQLLYILCVVVITSIGVIDAVGYIIRFETKKSRCLNPPRTARKVESVITHCQDEVKTKLVNEAYEILKEQVSQDQPRIDPNDDTIDYMWPSVPSGSSGIELDHPPTGPLNASHYEYILFDEPEPHRRMARLMKNIRRLDGARSDIYHPTLVPLEDKRIAGCLLHCVYAKNHAIDHMGWPTLDGLVQFYSEGVHEHGFFMATLRSVNLCLRAMTTKYRVNRQALPQKGESCDLAFDVFDCISDQITGYCLDQYSRY